jgi:hypothetical protein
MKRAHVVFLAAAGIGLIGAAMWGTRVRSASARPAASVSAPAPARVEAADPGIGAGQRDMRALATADVGPARFDPMVSAMVDEFARLDDELSGGLEIPADWQVSAVPQPPPATPMPALARGATPAAQLAEASRWFDSLPRDDAPTSAELDAKRARMSKAGLDLLQSECRAGVCRLSFAYSALSSERLARRLGGRDSARARPNWWSFTIIRPDGRVEGHVFMVGGASRGGAQ